MDKDRGRRSVSSTHVDGVKVQGFLNRQVGKTSRQADKLLNRVGYSFHHWRGLAVRGIKDVTNSVSLDEVSLTYLIRYRSQYICITRYFPMNSSITRVDELKAHSIYICNE